MRPTNSHEGRPNRTISESMTSRWFPVVPEWFPPEIPTFSEKGNDRMRKRSKCETKTSTQVVPSGSRNHPQDHTCGSREKNLRFVIAILQGTTGCHNPRPPQVVPKPFKPQATRRTPNRKEKHHGKHPLTHMEGTLRELRTQQADLPQPPTTLLPTLHPLKVRSHEENQNHA